MIYETQTEQLACLIVGDPLARRTTHREGLASEMCGVRSEGGGDSQRIDSLSCGMLRAPGLQMR